MKHCQNHARSSVLNHHSPPHHSPFNILISQHFNLSTPQSPPHHSPSNILIFQHFNISTPQSPPHHSLKKILTTAFPRLGYLSTRPLLRPYNRVSGIAENPQKHHSPPPPLPGSESLGRQTAVPKGLVIFLRQPRSIAPA